MEIIVSLIAVGVVAGVIIFLLNRDEDFNENPPVTPTPTPTLPPIEIEEVFLSSSVLNNDSVDSETSIQFNMNGEVVSTYTIGNNIRTTTFSTNVLEGFPSTPEFEIISTSGSPFLGPRSGSLDESPFWTLNLETPNVGIRNATFLVELKQGNVSKVFKVSLLLEVPDFRV